VVDGGHGAVPSVAGPPAHEAGVPLMCDDLLGRQVQYSIVSIYFTGGQLLKKWDATSDCESALVCGSFVKNSTRSNKLPHLRRSLHCLSDFVFASTLERESFT
jgi:hypothetical protein